MKMDGSKDPLDIFRKEVFNNEEMKIEGFQTIPTGIVTLDKILGGGVMIGGIIEFIGLEGSGKSTIGAKILAEGQKLGYPTIYLDTECAMSEKRLQSLGVDTENYIYSQPDCLEDVYNTVADVIKSSIENKVKEPILIVWDSLAATPSKKEVETEEFDKEMAIRARVNSSALRKLTVPISKSNVCFVIINQMRQNVGAMAFSPKWTSPGGMAVKYAAFQRVEISTTGKYELVKDAQDQTAKKVEFYTAKNKIHRPLLSTTAIFDFNKGDFDIPMSVFEHLKEKKYLASRGPNWILSLPETDDVTFKKTDWNDVYEANKEKIYENL